MNLSGNNGELLNEYAVNVAEGIRALAATIAVATVKYDLHTWFHHEDCRKYMLPLCVYYKLSARETEALVLAAEVHDIGKFAILDVLLANRDKTLASDAPEMQAIRKHPHYGHVMLSAFISKMGMAIAPACDAAIILSAVLWHHERWNGTGYPSGLSRYSIPFGARMMAVVDAVSAMAMPERHWKSPLTLDEIVNELKNGAGEQFDPEIAEIMANILVSGRVHGVQDMAKT